MHSFCDERGWFVRVCVVHAGRAGRGETRTADNRSMAVAVEGRSQWTADSTVRHQRRYGDRVNPSTTRLVNITMNFCVANGKSPVLRSAGASIIRGGFFLVIHAETDDSRDFFSPLLLGQNSKVLTSRSRLSAAATSPRPARPPSSSSQVADQAPGPDQIFIPESAPRLATLRGPISRDSRRARRVETVPSAAQA